MEEIDVSLPSKFMDACVAKNRDKALRLAKLMAKQHNCTLKAELDLLDFDASILSSEYRLPITTMIKELRKHEAQRSINYCSRDTHLLRCSRICGFCPMSDLKYQKGEWYRVQEDGTLKPVNYEKEVKEYYKKWRDRYGNQTRNRHQRDKRRI